MDSHSTTCTSLASKTVSQPFLPRSTLGQLIQYLAASLDAKIGPKINKGESRRHP